MTFFVAAEIVCSFSKAYKSFPVIFSLRSWPKYMEKCSFIRFETSYQSFRNPFSAAQSIVRIRWLETTRVSNQRKHCTVFPLFLETWKYQPSLHPVHRRYVKIAQFLLHISGLSKAVIGCLTKG